MQWGWAGWFLKSWGAGGSKRKQRFPAFSLHKLSVASEAAAKVTYCFEWREHVTVMETRLVHRLHTDLSTVHVDHCAKSGQCWYTTLLRTSRTHTTRNVSLFRLRRKLKSNWPYYYLAFQFSYCNLTRSGRCTDIELGYGCVWGFCSCRSRTYALVAVRALPTIGLCCYLFFDVGLVRLCPEAKLNFAGRPWY